MVIPEPISLSRRNISLFLTSLGRSLDRTLGRGTLDNRGAREDYVVIALLVEEARLRFHSKTSWREDIKTQEWQAIRQELDDFLSRISQMISEDKSIGQKDFILDPIYGQGAYNQAAFAAIFQQDKKQLSLSRAFDIFIDYIHGIEPSNADLKQSLTFRDLEGIIPSQQIAPVQFDVKHNKLVVVSKRAHIRPLDQSNVSSAFAYIKDSGEDLIANLERSNCDKRLLDAVRSLHIQLEEDNIVRLGLMNISCCTMGTQFRSELSEALNGMLRSYNTSIALYVAQFPEWEQFTRNASQIELSDSDVAELGSVADIIIAKLEVSPHITDSDVPKTIAAVRQLLTNPAQTSRRIAFALLRTIENLVSAVLQHTMLFLAKTRDKSIEYGSSIASKVIISFLTIALVGATGIGAAAFQAGSPWVQQAAEIVRKQLEKLY